MERTLFDVLAELFEADLDVELVRRAKARTPTERIRWLEDMQAFADAAKKARNEADGTADTPD